MRMSKKRARRDYFKKRRARLKAEREAIERKVVGEWHPTKGRTDPCVALSESLLVRISRTMIATNQSENTPRASIRLERKITPGNLEDHRLTPKPDY